MMKKMLAMILAGIMVIGAAPAVFAGDTQTQEEGDDSLVGLLGSLFGKDGQLSGILYGEDGESGLLYGENGLSSILEGTGLDQYLPEGTDVGSLISTIGDQLSDTGSELYQTAENVAGMVTDDEGNLDLDNLDLNSIGGLLGGLLSGAMTGEEQADENLAGEDLTYEEMTEEYPDTDLLEELEPAIKAFVIEDNAEFMDAGDYQTVASTVTETEEQEDGTVKVLGYFLQANYTQEDTDLVLVGAAGDHRLLTLGQDESGEWAVIDAQKTEDGEGFTDSLAVMCEEMGLTTDEYFETQQFSELNDLYTCAELLETTEGAERIEYAGEMLTAEELEEKGNAIIEEVFSALFGGLAEMLEAETEG